MTEDRTIKFIKDVLLNGNNPHGKEAENNLRWGLQEYLKQQLFLHGVSNNEAVLQYETCQRGRITRCKCKNDQDCKEQSEVAYYCECDNQVGKKDVSGTLYCINCELDIEQ